MTMSSSKMNDDQHKLDQVRDFATVLLTPGIVKQLKHLTERYSNNSANANVLSPSDTENMSQIIDNHMDLILSGLTQYQIRHISHIGKQIQSMVTASIEKKIQLIMAEDFQHARSAGWPLADEIKETFEPELLHMPKLSHEELDQGMNAFRQQRELNAAELVKPRISQLELRSGKDAGESKKEADAFESQTDKKVQAEVVAEEKKGLGGEIEDTMQQHRSAPGNTTGRRDVTLVIKMIDELKLTGSRRQKEWGRDRRACHFQQNCVRVERSRD